MISTGIHYFDSSTLGFLIATRAPNYGVYETRSSGNSSRCLTNQTYNGWVNLKQILPGAYLQGHSNLLLTTISALFLLTVGIILPPECGRKNKDKFI